MSCVYVDWLLAVSGGTVHPVGSYCTDKKEYERQEAALYNGKNDNDIILNNKIIRFKLIHSYVTEFLRCNRRKL